MANARAYAKGEEGFAEDTAKIRRGDIIGVEVSGEDDATR